MKKTIGAVACLALCAGLVWAARGQEGMPMPKPQKEHEILKQFEGNWDSTVSFRMSADQQWTASKGVESNRVIGGFWLISESKGDMMGMPFTGIGQTGYDPYKKKYVSTWVDSFSPVLSVGEGTFDGKVLTTSINSTDCETGKPCTMTMTQEFKDKDTVLWSMRMNGKDGKEFECMKGESKRKK
ncbi:MAG TPA: DUF1579 domain-containing protein [Planctomycetota bacterium]|nr:DUF1579 domain-containing protein [Planctomycetota bacterium]